MDKKLIAHEKFIKKAINQFETKLTDTKTSAEIDQIHLEIKKLNDFHQIVVRDFQHERLIHLIVTFFFSGLLIVAIICLFLLSLVPVSYTANYLGLSLLLICLILSVTDVFYVRHYYRLENGTQRLYDLSRKLYNL
jgi:hypothetical protein